MPTQDSKAPHLFYLHGFASSARSSKAGFLAEKLRPHGLVLHTPDFNEPDFSTLTVTRMVEQVGRDIESLAPAPIGLVGSSLGAFVAVQVALARPEQVDRLVLLAPAIDFGRDGGRDFGGVTLDEWERRGHVNVFHYGYGRLLPVHYELYTDACSYDCLGATLRMPVQIFQGRRDTVVDPSGVEAWAAARPGVELHMLDDDHQLMGSLDYIWRHMAAFLSADRLRG